MAGQHMDRNGQGAHAPRSPFFFVSIVLFVLFVVTISCGIWHITYG